jgi:deoxyribose-phosphate aldolase
MKKASIASCIDLTLLAPFALNEDIHKLCLQAMRFGFYSVCINPVNVKFVKKELSGSGVKVCSVVGFPFGANKKEIKAFEAKTAIKEGAQEIDMVMNIAAFKNGDVKLAQDDLNAVIRAAEPHPVKVIIETCYLNDDEKVNACKMIMHTNAQFVKTSTGFGSAGATESYIRLILIVVGNNLKIKATGGIHTLKFALALIEAGADRLGTSKGVEIIAECD